MRSSSLTLLLAGVGALAACADSTRPPAPPQQSQQSQQSQQRTPSLAGEAAIVYSNFGPGMTFDTDPTHADIVDGALYGSEGRVVSVRFKPSADFTFTDVQLPLALLSGPAEMVVYLRVDFYGMPGDVIEAIPLHGVTSTAGIVVASSSFNPLLESGRQYWISTAIGASGASARWQRNSVGDLEMGPSGDYVARSAFQVDGRTITGPGNPIHFVSGGGSTGNITYGVTARVRANGTTDGRLSVVYVSADRHNFPFEWHVKGEVTCVHVVGNRAYVTGRFIPPNNRFFATHFSVTLVDNGQGANASAADSVSQVIPMEEEVPCYGRLPSTELTKGNVRIW